MAVRQAFFVTQALIYALFLCVAVGFLVGPRWLGIVSLWALGLILFAVVVCAFVGGIGIPLAIVRDWRTYPLAGKVVLGFVGAFLAIMMATLIIGSAWLALQNAN